MFAKSFKGLGRHFAVLLVIFFASGAAYAAPGATNAQTDGAATAQVVGMFEIAPITDLRFGAIMQPSTNGTVTVGSDGTVTTPLTFSNTSGPRGPASFVVRGDPNRLFVTFLPGSTAISNGTSNMTVNQFRANTVFFGLARLSSTGLYILNVGGRLSVNANQEPGSYTGTFDVTVLYL